MLKTKISALKGICVLVLLLMLGSYDLLAQNRKVTLTVKNETIGNVLKSIEDETGYMFIYRDGAVDKSRRVSISVEDVDVLDVLKVIFQGTDTEASIINNNISLVKKPASPSVVSAPATVQSLKTVKGTVMTGNQSLELLYRLTAPRTELSQISTEIILLRRLQKTLRYVSHVWDM